MGSETAARPAGLGYRPAGAEKYDPRKDIPPDALDAKDFKSIDAWLDACVAQNKAGKIGSGTYEVDGEPRYAPKGIYGYGNTPPKFVADNVDCWLYLKNQDVTLKGLAFEGFGQVLSGAVSLADGSPYHSTTKYAFERFMPKQDGGTALELQLPASKATVGPDVDISDCRFVNCENAFTFVSDTVQMGKVDFNNNVLTGTYGILDIDSLYWTEVNAAGNEWANATGARAQPNVKQSGVQTGFKIGTDHYVPLKDHYTKLAIVNNYAHDIQSVGTYADTNAATFVDARGVESARRGDNVVSFNQIERLQGLRGQEDANAIYAKAWGLIVQGNRIEDSGAAYLDAKRNGSETTGVLVKPMKDGVAKDIEVIGNTFSKMPVAPKGVSPDLSVVKISEAVGDSAISFNTFVGGGNLSGSPASGVIRWFGDYDKLKVVGNSFVDSKFGPGDNAIAFHQLKVNGAGTAEVSNNSATKTTGNYDGDARLVLFSGETPKVLVSGHNTLDGGHAMLLSKSGTGNAPVRTYDPPTGSPGSPSNGSPGNPSNGSPGSPPNGSPGNGGYDIGIDLRKAIQENTGSQTLVASLSANVASRIASIDDPRFFVKDGGIYLKQGQTVDYEETPVLNLKLSVDTPVGKLAKSFTVQVGDVDEAPTAIAVANVRTLAENASARTMVADVKVSDPDEKAAFRDNPVSVSDNRFEVADGHLFLKAGQKVDGDDDGIRLVLKTDGASGPIQTAVDIEVGASKPGGNQPGEGGGSPTAPPKPPPSQPGTPAPEPGTPSGWSESDSPAHVVTGTSERDDLVGTAGADLIDGRAREDVMTGGGGDDTYAVSGYRDAVVEKANGGVDTVELRDNRYFLPENVENLVAKTSDVLLVGNASANILTGSQGSDVFIGGMGNDLMHLGGGADVVIVAPGDGDDVVTGFGGDDKLSVAGTSFASFADVKEHLHQAGADAVLDLNGGGSVTLRDVNAASLTAKQFELDNSARAAADGAAPQHTVNGSAASEALSGTAANDLVDGKGGTDVMKGGKGDDTYGVDNANDRIVEAQDGGTDEVAVLAKRYALDPHVENVTVRYASGASIEGNALGNIIVGGAGNDTIEGGGGADELRGGSGRDVFVFSHLSDLGDRISDFMPGEDQIDLTPLLAETAGTITTAATQAGVGIYFDHDGTKDLVALVKNIASLGQADIIT